MKTTSILTKRPWLKRIPDGTNPHAALNLDVQSIGGHAHIVYSQQRMLDEYYPSAHDIYNKALYPDIPHEVEEVVTHSDGTEELVKHQYFEDYPRVAFSYQQEIETKRTDHLTGNDVVFNRNWDEQDERKDKLFQELVDAWEQMGMEDAVFESAHNANIVGDCALVFYVYTDEFGDQVTGWNVYSFFKGDKIYAHRNPRTGRVFLFAREFRDDYDNAMVEVWDNHYYYRFRARANDETEVKAHYEFTEETLAVGEKGEEVKFMRPTGFVLDGYILQEQTSHKFPFCPVAYKRNEDGPVWVFSQDTIEAYEEDFNGLRHNNKTYGEPILATKGDDVEGVPEANGTVKFMSMGKDDSAAYLQAQSAADSYMKALDKMEELIYIQSFIVKTPELKSGDLPAAALKILYSPAVEKAMHEVKEWQPFIDTAFAIFRYAMGLVRGKTLDYNPTSLPIKVFLVPYIHQSNSALVADIVQAVNSKCLSRRSAAERLSGYLAEENEWERIVAEEKKEQEADLIYQTALTNATQNETDTDTDSKTTKKEGD